MPTGTVYSNWPTENTPLRKVTSLAFSPVNNLINTYDDNYNITGSDLKNYLAIGNNKGKVFLYQINHIM